MYSIPKCQPVPIQPAVARLIAIHVTIFVLLFSFVLLTGSLAHAQFTPNGDPVTGFEIPNGTLNQTGEVSADVVANSAPFSPSDNSFGSSRSTGVGSASKRLFDVLRSGGILMIPILLCSVVLVVFIFERMISLRKARVIPGPFSTAVEVEQAVLDEGERTSSRLRSYLRLINGVATVCPLLGMLGTVLGMIHAFDAIATVDATMSDPKALIATGISQALLTTAAGMTVAIPALIAYLFFSSRVDKHVMEIDSLGMKVVNLISAETLSAKKPTRASKSKAA